MFAHPARRSRRLGRKASAKTQSRLTAAVVEALERRSLLSGVAFAAPVVYPIGGDASDIVTADVTGDGHQDIVTANYNGTVSVLLNNGNGTFKPAKTFSDGLGSNPGLNDGDMAVADLGKGHPDILVASGYTPGVVEVLIGNGDGTFQAPTPVTVNNNYAVDHLAVGDLGNGEQDLVTGNDNGTVSIFLGNGDGTFQAPQTINVGGDIHSITLADINGDGDTDIVIGNKGTGTVIALLNNGHGTFGAPQTITATGTDVKTADVADLNGNPDLIVFNKNGTEDVALGNGAGTFQAAVQVFNTGSTDYGGFLTGDFNGDGKLDLITGTPDVPLSVLLGNGNGTFQSPVSASFSITKDNSGATAAELTGDGKTDIIFAYDNSAHIDVRLNTSPTVAATTTSLASSLNPATAGQAVTLTATVTAISGSPGGTVTFKDGTAILGTGSINTSTHTATLVTSKLAVGAHGLTAVYAATSGFSSSTAPALTETINAAPAKTTTTTLASSSNPATLGQKITLTATVTATSGSPTGTVTFNDGTTTLGTASVNAITHKATLMTSSLALGAHSLTAAYGGATGFVASTSAILSETINPVPAVKTTITLASSSNPATVGQTITLTATVTATSGSPGGAVTFMDGTTTLGVASINTTTHKATFTTSSLALGANSLTAVYAGTSAFMPSTSAAVTETINNRFPNILGTFAGTIKVTAGTNKGATQSIQMDITTESQTTGDFSGTGAVHGDFTISGAITTSGAVSAVFTDTGDTLVADVTGTFAKGILTGKFAKNDGSSGTFTATLS